MGLTTIQWTSYHGPDGTMLPGYTFNPWIGCSKVQAACDNCYAETEDKRRAWTVDGWGAGKPRYSTTQSNWQKPIKWNRDAGRVGVRPFVFCASLADVFDGEVPDAWRFDLFSLVRATPNLIWLLLTKRPGLALRWQHNRMANGEWSLPNAWIGYSAGTQKDLDAGANAILRTSAPIRFLSLEPLLEQVDVSQILSYKGDPETSGASNLAKMRGIDWVIVGGESGPKARPMHPCWVRSLRDQCQAAGVPFHFKQYGEWEPFYDRDHDDPDWRAVPTPSKSEQFLNIAGGQGFHGDRVVALRRVGKHAAGRTLDGRTHDDFPEVRR